MNSAVRRNIKMNPDMDLENHYRPREWKRDKKSEAQLKAPMVLDCPVPLCTAVLSPTDCMR